MANSDTKYKKNYNLKATIICSIILIVIIGLLICGIINSTDIVTSSIYLIFLFLIIIALIGALSGVLKGKIQIARENRYIKKTNPYIYYRELPNNFGIGVTSLLWNSTIENYKDIVAVILDLCARKYLNLIKQNDKYIIQILKPIDGNLLSNEKYILTLINNKNMKNLNYQEWYNYCLEDGINLGLYYRKEIKISNEVPLTQDIIKKRNKMHLFISFISSIIIMILFLFQGNILMAIGYTICWFIFTYIALLIPFALINAFTSFKNIGKQTKTINYKNIMENTLKKTKKGIDELHKLYSFKAFIKNFGNFVDKKVEEVVIWERYLSYAQLFGLTKEIMNSGYKELIDNSAFQIDNIDNINLNNIEISSK